MSRAQRAVQKTKRVKQWRFVRRKATRERLKGTLGSTRPMTMAPHAVNGNQQGCPVVADHGHPILVVIPITNQTNTGTFDPQ
jgi:hypothetical protein